jgi:hypothetical protein
MALSTAEVLASHTATAKGTHILSLRSSGKHQCVGQRLLPCGQDNLKPGSPNTTYSCSQHGPVTTRFGWAGPGNFIPVPKIYPFLGVGIHCLSQWTGFS